MKKGQVGMMIGLIAIVVIAFIGLGIAGSYNGLVRADTSVGQNWGNVQSAYQRRADLVPNLIATVKQYSNYEGDVLEKVTAARASVGSAKTPAELQAAGGSLDSAIGRLLVVMEAYPDLKANQNYLSLQSQLEGTENRIQTERNNYNAAVMNYQNAVRVFPTNMIAGMTGFSADKWQTFTSQQGSDVAPNATLIFNQNRG